MDLRVPGMSPEECAVIRKETARKIVQLSYAFLQESLDDPGNFGRDVYDALEATYPDADRKGQFAKAIEDLEAKLVSDHGAVHREPLKALARRSVFVTNHPCNQAVITARAGRHG